jgi:hypothetical protein
MMKWHECVYGWKHFKCGLAAAWFMLFSFIPAQAAAIVPAPNAGFAVKVSLVAADKKPSNNPNSGCSVTSLKLPNSALLNISCKAAEAIASHYYKMPFYTLFNASQATWALPNQSSGIGLGTTSSLRVLHEPDDELLEVWVSW